MNNKTNNGVLLSIITVCLNDAVRLKITVESLRAYYGDSRFEHIIMDGGSSDETASFITSQEAQINFKYYSLKDSGIYDAMNRGIMFARGEMILFLNCGDVILASLIETANFLSQLFDDSELITDFDIACFAVKQVQGNRVKTFIPNMLMQYKMPISHQGMLFSLRFLRENNYRIEYKIAGDYDLYLRAKKVIIVPGVTLMTPLVCVEAEGFASNNPIRAYSEYIIIAYKRLNGWIRFKIMIFIVSRALIVISLKSMIPKRYICILRSLF